MTIDEQPSKEETRNRHEREMRQLILGAQRMANAAQTRAERAQSAHADLLQKYMDLMIRREPRSVRRLEANYAGSIIMYIVSGCILVVTVVLLANHFIQH